MLFLSASALTACGGGGGGGSTASPSPAPGFTVSIDRTQLVFVGDEGNGISPQAVLGSGSGTPPVAIYTGSLDLGTAIDRVTAQVIGTEVKFTIYPKSTLPAGDYLGSVQFFACADEKCAQHFSGSPTNVPYKVTVRKALKVSPTSLTLSAVSGATASRDIAVQLPNDVNIFTLNSSSTWLSTSNITATGFSVKATALPAGTYFATLSVITPGRTLDIPVTYSVLSDATTVSTIRSDIANLSFSATASLDAPAKALNITLPSWSNELSFEVQYGRDTDWLSVTKTGDRQLSVSASAAKLVPGNYTAQLVLKSGYLTTPIQIPVNFTVGTPAWQITGTSAFTVNAATTASQLNGDIAIATPNLPGQTWQASTSTAWLKLLNASGTTGVDMLHVAIDMVELAKLANFGSYSADIAIASSSGKVAGTKTTITLSKRLPELNFVSPRMRLPGEGGAVIARGRGFDAVTDLNAALTVSGATIQGITRVNDSQLVLQVAGMASGEASFALKNGLSQATTSASLKVVPARSYSYKAIATQGVKGALLYDPARQSIYVTNKTLGTLMRFAFNNGNWTVSAADLATIESAQMAPDGSSIVASATSGKMVLFDPDTLAVQASYPVDHGYVSGYNLNSLPTMAMLNDGKAIFDGASSGVSGVAYFDLITRKFGALATPNNFGFHSNSPAFNASGDGSRLFIGFPTNSALDALYYADAADGAIKLNGGGIAYWYGGAQSQHADRMTLATYEVRDRDFNRMGGLTLPSTDYYGRTAVFAPDAMRVYILAYSQSQRTARVFVFNTSTKPLTTTDLPLIGYFDVADYPTCTGYDCNAFPLGTITPDGTTLFFVGGTNLLVVPVPGNLLPAPAAAVPRIQRAKSSDTTVPGNMERHTLN